MDVDLLREAEEAGQKGRKLGHVQGLFLGLLAFSPPGQTTEAGFKSNAATAAPSPQCEALNEGRRCPSHLESLQKRRTWAEGSGFGGPGSWV